MNYLDQGIRNYIVSGQILRYKIHVKKMKI